MTPATTNPYALVTGATMGMGYELAKLLAQDGHNLILVARTEADLRRVAEELHERYGVTVRAIAKDLFGVRAGTELYEEVKGLGIEIEVLVNDAGQGRLGLFTELDLEDQLSLINLNIISFTRLTYHFLKDMTARNRGKILQPSVRCAIAMLWGAPPPLGEGRGGSGHISKNRHATPRDQRARSGGRAQPPINTVKQPDAMLPPWAVASPSRAAGIPPISTVEEPCTMLSGGPTHRARSPTRAAGKPPISTVGWPGPRTGPPTCGMGGTAGVRTGHACMSVRRAAGGMSRNCAFAAS